MPHIKFHRLVVLLAILAVAGFAASIAMGEEEEETGMKVAPDPVKFTGAKSKGLVTAYNETSVPLKNLMIDVPAGFKAMQLCKAKDLPKLGSTCQEEIICETAKSTGFVVILAEPITAASAKLEDC